MKRILAEFLLAVWVVAILGILSGCALKHDEEVVVKDIVGISHHERDLYTFRIQTDGSQEISRQTINFWNKPREIADVPIGKKMWVKYTLREIHGVSQPVKINGEIHFRNVKDIQGGGWDHGKHGRGTTTVLE
jgi:hypothetical protein